MRLSVFYVGRQTPTRELAETRRSELEATLTAEILRRSNAELRAEELNQSVASLSTETEASLLGFMEVFLHHRHLLLLRGGVPLINWRKLQRRHVAFELGGGPVVRIASLIDVLWQRVEEVDVSGSAARCSDVRSTGVRLGFVCQSGLHVTLAAWIVYSASSSRTRKQFRSKSYSLLFLLRARV